MLLFIFAPLKKLSKGTPAVPTHNDKFNVRLHRAFADTDRHQIDMPRKDKTLTFNIEKIGIYAGKCISILFYS